jgi:hypothetical protein
MLQEDIKTAIKNAMKERDEDKLTTLRGLSSAITNELVAQKKKPSETLPDDEVLKVIKRQVKQRKDSIEQFEKGNRQDLADIEKKELSFLETYLPEEMSDEIIKKIIDEKKSELGINDKSKMGNLMSAVMKETKGNADGARVKTLVEDALS